jgi:Zn-dependent peptidase ImmA (M78 family)/transcriptional regulator with XRE-family HTH domain
MNHEGPNYRMINVARKMRGLTASALAAKIGVSPSSISRWESGLVEAPNDALRQIAGALGLRESFFFRREPIKGLGISGLLHRSLKKARRGDVDRIESLCNVFCWEIRDLLRSVDLYPELDFPQLPDSLIGQPAEAARAVRAAWNLPQGPIDDLTALIESAGGIVVRWNFEVREMDALCTLRAGLPPLFFLNASLPLDRARFVLAHELGHVFLHADHGICDDQSEDEADAFAAEFLTPKKDVGFDLAGRRRLEQFFALKPKWKVPASSLITRAYELRLISAQQRAHLYRTSGGVLRDEPAVLNLEERPRLLRTVLDYHRDDLRMTDDQIAERVRISTHEFHDRYGSRLRLHSWN